MDHAVDKVKVGRNNVRVFRKFTGRKVGTANSVTYYVSEFSTETITIDQIYEILDRYLEMSSIYNEENKMGIVVKNYGTFGPGKYVFGEYVKNDS